MRKYLFFNLLILLLAGSTANVNAQSAAGLDSLDDALHNTIALYREKVRDNSFLFHGREYTGWDNRIEGHAYFLIDEWQEGSLHYKGQLYQHVPIRYDIAAEELVVKHYAGVFKIRLYKEKISHFSLSGHLFINLEAADAAAVSAAAAGVSTTADTATGAAVAATTVLNDAKGSPMLSGFYDLLSGGNTQLLVKRRKSVKESIDNNQLHREFIQKNLYFIEKDGQYHPVKSKGSALKVLADQKKEIRQYLKKNKIKFRQNPELALLSMVEYYNQATEQP
ncbi:hypothetical protein [Cesiribacter sp. SM1]|uniref:hypothetical protein n=1 Tax=Cesiribacter sp. SM1 TaxID=2861196 RepID=UPI001CD4B973|nr:hypothetical protein [Cesiribacter sp. SM1]